MICWPWWLWAWMTVLQLTGWGFAGWFLTRNRRAWRAFRRAAEGWEAADAGWERSTNQNRELLESVQRLDRARQDGIAALSDDQLAALSGWVDRVRRDRRGAS